MYNRFAVQSRGNSRMPKAAVEGIRYLADMPCILDPFGMDDNARYGVGRTRHSRTAHRAGAGDRKEATFLILMITDAGRDELASATA
jgi:hypothetical protein